MKTWVWALILLPPLIGVSIYFASITPPPATQAEADRARLAASGYVRPKRVPKIDPMPSWLPSTCKAFVRADTECIAIAGNEESDAMLNDLVRSWAQYEQLGPDVIGRLGSSCQQMLVDIAKSTASVCPDVRWEVPAMRVVDPATTPIGPLPTNLTPRCAAYVRGAIACYSKLGTKPDPSWDMLKAQIEAMSMLAKMGKAVEAERSCEDDIAIIRRLADNICPDVAWD